MHKESSLAASGLLFLLLKQAETNIKLFFAASSLRAEHLAAAALATRLLSLLCMNFHLFLVSRLGHNFHEAMAPFFLVSEEKETLVSLHERELTSRCPKVLSTATLFFRSFANRQ